MQGGHDGDEVRAHQSVRGICRGLFWRVHGFVAHDATGVHVAGNPWGNEAVLPKFLDGTEELATGLHARLTEQVRGELFDPRPGKGADQLHSQPLR